MELSGQGRLAAFTAIYIAPTFMVEQGYGRERPYVSGVVELDEGVKISARIVGLEAENPAAIQVGTPLSVEYLQEGQGEARKAYLAFRP